MIRARYRPILLVSAIVLYGFVLTANVLTIHTYEKKADFYEYAMLADNLWHGRGLMFEGYVDVIMPPGWPMLMGAIHFLIDDWPATGKALNLLLLLASLYLFFQIARRFLDQWWSCVAAALLGLNSNIVINACDGYSEGLFLVLFLTLVRFCIQSQERPATTLWLGFAINWAFLYYVRPEGLLIGLIGFVWIARSNLRSAVWIIPIIVVILIFPYLVFLKSETGIWQVSGKTHLNLVMGELQSPYQTGASYSDPRYDRYYDYLKDPTLARGIGDYWQDPHSDIVSRIPVNFRKLVETYAFTFSLGCLVIIGSLFSTWPGKRFVMSFLLPVSVYLVVFVLPRTIAVYHWILVLMLIFGLKDGLLRLNSAGISPHSVIRIQNTVLILAGLYEFRVCLKNAAMFGFGFLR